MHCLPGTLLPLLGSEYSPDGQLHLELHVLRTRLLRHHLRQAARQVIRASQARTMPCSWLNEGHSPATHAQLPCWPHLQHLLHAAVANVQRKDGVSGAQPPSQALDHGVQACALDAVVEVEVLVKARGRS